MERIMVIGGGEWQTALVRKLKEMGYETVNSNLYKDSPAFAYADYCEVADVLDKEKNLEIARKYNVDAVLTDESDIAVQTVAYVASSLGLVSIGQEMAELFTNKYKMRRFCESRGFKTPEFRLCHYPSEAADFVRMLGRKAIMKPLDSQSSRGVFILNSPEDAYSFFNDSVCHSRNEEAVIVERYIEGKEFTVDGIVLHGKHHSLAVSEKKHYEYNKSIASELFFSHENPKYDYKKLRDTNDRFVNSAGLPFGLTHAEYKCEDGEFYLVEIAARGGGTRISSHIVPLMTGFDNYKLLVGEALGREPDFEIPKDIFLSERCAVLKFFDVPVNGGYVREILGEDEIRSNEKVLELHLEFKKGDQLYRAQDDRSRIGFYIAWGESREELQKTMEWVESTLKIIESRKR